MPFLDHIYHLGCFCLSDICPSYQTRCCLERASAYCRSHSPAPSTALKHSTCSTDVRRVWQFTNETSLGVHLRWTPRCLGAETAGWVGPTTGHICYWAPSAPGSSVVTSCPAGTCPCSTPMPLSTEGTTLAWSLDLQIPEEPASRHRGTRRGKGRGWSPLCGCSGSLQLHQAATPDGQF